MAVTLWTDEDTNTLRRLIETDGMSVKEAAKFFGVNVDAIYYRAKINSIKINKKATEWNTSLIKKKMFEMHRDEYTLLSEYSGFNEYITVRHNSAKCNNHVWEITPANFIYSKKKCSSCYGNKLKTTKKFKEEVFALCGDEYTVLGEYTKAKNSILMRHNSEFCDNFIEERTPDAFLHKGIRCSKCSKRFLYSSLRKTQKEFEQEVFDIVSTEYLVLSEYINNKTKVRMKHNKDDCNYIYHVTPHHFLYNKRRCPKCNESKGEERVSSILERKDLLYIREYQFDDLRNKKRLQFDFAVFSKKKKPLFLIEYDGKHHFEPVQFGGMPIKEAKNNLKKQIKNDTLKDVYCKENNIDLLRIPYWEYEDIENKINEKMKGYDEK